MSQEAGRWKCLIISGLIVCGAVAANLQAGEIHARRGNQQDRIAQGVASGQLTACETGRLENKEARLNHEIARDRFRNGGNLTNHERRQINHQQNVLSRDIYCDKHNAFVQ